MRATVTKIFCTLAVLAFLTLNHQLSTASAQSTEVIGPYFLPIETYYYASSLTLGPDGNFYGIAEPGIPQYSTNIVVYAITTNGTVTEVHAFTGTVSNDQGVPTNSDGAAPTGVFVAGADGYLYGTTYGGGSYGNGTLFRMANGTFTTVVSFANPNEQHMGLLTPGADGYFYGTFNSIGSFSDGSFVRMATNGAYALAASFAGTNGSGPVCLTLGRDGSFYGTTIAGGINGDGIMFRVTTNGALTTIISYGGTNGEVPGNMILGADGNFYGFTYSGGTNGNGSIYRVTTNGIVTTFYSFSPLGFDPNFDWVTNADGAGPVGLVMGPDGNLYGVTVEGGVEASGGGGTMFQVTRNGTVTIPAYVPVLFPGDFVFPLGGLTLGPDGNFYGTASANNLGNALTGFFYQFSMPFPEPNIYGIYSTPSAGSTTVLMASLPGTTNILYGTTNLTLPLGQWHSLATNTAPTTGFFQHLDSTTKGVPAKFYTLKLTR